MLNDLSSKQKDQLEALTAIIDCVSDDSIINKVALKEINARLDSFLKNLDDNKKFFKRFL